MYSSSMALYCAGVGIPRLVVGGGRGSEVVFGFFLSVEVVETVLETVGREDLLSDSSENSSSSYASVYGVYFAADLLVSGRLFCIVMKTDGQANSRCEL